MKNLLLVSLFSLLILFVVSPVKTSFAYTIDTEIVDNNPTKDGSKACCKSDKAKCDKSKCDKSKCTHGDKEKKCAGHAQGADKAGCCKSKAQAETKSTTSEAPKRCCSTHSR